MDKAKVEKWLNRITNATKKLVNIKDFSDELGWCSGSLTKYPDNIPTVHLYNGIHEIGEMFGLDVKEDKEDEQYSWYSVMWNDVMLIQLDLKKENENETDN